MRLAILVAMLMARVVAEGQSPAAADNEQPASVQGIVINSVTGAPISHAHVIFRDFSNSHLYGALSTLEGLFSMASVAPGSYTANVERQGYFMPKNNQSSNGQVVVELKSGQHLGDLSFRLIPSSAISGHVVDENNSPVENVLVKAIRGDSTAAALTNDRGEFRIGGLEGGRYLVEAGQLNPQPPEIRTDGSTDVAYGPTFYPGTLDRHSALPVKAARGQETAGVDIRLLRIPIVRLSGKVWGVPKNAQSIGVMLRSGNSGESIEVGPDFRFTVWRLPPGTYWLTAQCQDLSGKRLQGPELRIDLSDRNIDNADLTLSGPFELRGRVIGHSSMSLSSSLVDTRLELVLGNSGSTAVASDGRFVIPALRPGLHHVTLRGLKRDEYVKAVRIGFAEYPGRIIGLQNGAPREPVEIIVGKGVGQISGVVRDENGRPKSTPVALLTDDIDGFEQFPITNSDSGGRYSFKDVPPGTYKLVAFEMSDYSLISSPDGLDLYGYIVQTILIGENEKRSVDLTLLSSDE